MLPNRPGSKLMLPESIIKLLLKLREHNLVASDLSSETIGFRLESGYQPYAEVSSLQ